MIIFELPSAVNLTLQVRGMLHKDIVADTRNTNRDAGYVRKKEMLYILEARLPTTVELLSFTLAASPIPLNQTPYSQHQAPSLTL